MYTLHTATKTTSRRSDWDLQDSNRNRTDWQSYIFQLATDTHSLRGHSEKLFVPRCSTTVWKSFFSMRVINCWNALPQHVVDAPLTSAFKNRLDKHLMDMGAWKFRLSSSPAHNRQVQVKDLSINAHSIQVEW